MRRQHGSTHAPFPDFHAADAAGRDAFFGALANGTRDEAALAVLLASDEYFRRN